MPKLSIDNQQVEVKDGDTILDAAKKLGIEIPTLCFVEGRPPQTSCMVCLVKVNGRERLVPACATKARDGMQVESQTDQVRQARRTALELLLAEHVGDCIAPCQAACPAHMNIPLMIRQIAAGDTRRAIQTVTRHIALPTVLGRICPAPCEKACRRRNKDAPVAICLLKRCAADVNLASPQPWLPDRKAETHKKVAVVGAGATGLAAAYYLQRDGHACTIFDRHDAPGGRLRYADSETKPPTDVLDGEIDIIRKLGAEFRMNAEAGADPAMEALRRDFDAVVIAAGKSAPDQAERLGLPKTDAGIKVDSHTFASGVDGVFAAGRAVRARTSAVRAVADGKAVAASVDQFLRGQAPAAPPRPFSTHIGKLLEGEIDKFMEGASPDAQQQPAEGGAGLTEVQARSEAIRCLHCDCRKADNCKLRNWAQAYDAKARAYKLPRPPYLGCETRHPDVIYEPGKCIKCGLCVAIAADAGEQPGLSFTGRGFDVRIGVPFGESLADALKTSAADCVNACPTGALAFKDGAR